MINFRNYSTMTECVIPDKVQLSNTKFGSKFYNMPHLQYTYLSNKITSVGFAYRNCNRFIGPPACGPNVTNMSSVYMDCKNLTGSPVCGYNVERIDGAYQNCSNLTGSPVCGPKVTNLYYAYDNCPNLSSGNAYFYSNNITTVFRCFGNKNTSNRLNIYLPDKSVSLNCCLENKAGYSIVGGEVKWTNDVSANGYYYNTQYNVYIYPVADVSAVRKINGDE